MRRAAAAGVGGPSARRELRSRAMGGRWRRQGRLGRGVLGHLGTPWNGATIFLEKNKVWS